ncbi:MAG: dTDP-4-dehydrorhamnose 3,5-epimerase [Candidatus Rokubacteria bacterium]|nr:dTDP-4-dehydrorhamnose 3,5-epimerase [Candidatus Rokubacteria bacterium]
MIFTETAIGGAFVIEPERLEDQRGFFARTWCAREFEAHGLEARLVQCSISFNKRKGTLRGMHYQIPPAAESKLVRCTAGAIFDAIIDLRPGSPSFARHIAVVLSAENRAMLYIPAGVAHGFQTLADDTEIFYQMSEFHAPEQARGVRWDDTAFGIRWPEDTRIIAERDRTYPDFAGA